MKNIKLFADRMSHPSRFCIQFLKMNDIAYSEQKVDLLKGENFKNPDLPFKKVPVLHAEINNQPIIIAQSTTILRSLCETLDNVDEKWFPKTFNEHYRINEFIDFFHFSMNASLMRTFENKRLFKLKLKRQSPNTDVINIENENFEKSVKQFEKYFLGTKDFLGGNDLNIADLIATATLEQSFLIDFERSSDLQNYLDRCSEVIPEYHEILNDLKAAPKRIRPNW